MKALGMVELNSIAKGIECTDIMLKSADIDILFSKHICPGKYMIIISGDVESINESIEAAYDKGKKNIVGNFILPNAHHELLEGINRKFKSEKINAIGVMEFSSVAAGVKALDTALKNGQVTLVKLTLGNLIGGKCYFILTGFISAVDEALKAAEKVVEEKKLINKVLIPSPDEALIKSLV